MSDDSHFDAIGNTERSAPAARWILGPPTVLIDIMEGSLRYLEIYYQRIVKPTQDAMIKGFCPAILLFSILVLWPILLVILLVKFTKG